MKINKNQDKGENSKLGSVVLSLQSVCNQSPLTYISDI